MSKPTPASQSSPRFSREYVASLEYWPDPWEAPEVPPPALLSAWEEGTVTDADLDAQVGESINCMRALQLLALGFMEEGVGDLGLHLPVLRAEGPATTPQAGQLWTTRSAVEAFADGVPYRRRWTFDPVSVLLLSGPAVTENDRIWRVAVITPEGNWPEEWRGSRDRSVVAHLGGEAAAYVAHLWLEYPVSESQLHATFGEVAPGTLQAVWTAPEGEAGSAEEDEEGRMARERLLARASFLPMTADARRATREWWQGQWDLLGLVAVETGESVAAGRWHFHAETPPAEAVRKQIHLVLAHAAHTPGILASQAIAMQGRPEDLAREDVPSLLQQLKRAVSAPILLQPGETTAFSGLGFAQWDVAALDLPGDCSHPFVVLSPGLDRILAVGRVIDGVASAPGCDWEECKKVCDRWSDWVLVVFVSVS